MSSALDLDWSAETEIEEREKEISQSEQKSHEVVEEREEKEEREDNNTGNNNNNNSGNNNRNLNNSRDNNQNYRNNSGSYQKYNNNYNNNFNRNNNQQGGNRYNNQQHQGSYNNQQGNYNSQQGGNRYNNQQGGGRYNNMQNNQNKNFQPRNEIAFSEYPEDTTKEEIIELLKSNSIEFLDITFTPQETIVQCKDSDNYSKTKSLNRTQFKNGLISANNYRRPQQPFQQQPYQQQQQQSSYLPPSNDAKVDPQDLQNKPKVNPFGNARPVDHIKIQQQKNQPENESQPQEQGNSQVYRPRQNNNNNNNNNNNFKRDKFFNNKQNNKGKKEPDSEGFYSVKGPSGKSFNNTNTQTTSANNTPTKKVEKSTATKNIFDVLDSDEEN